jgi:hypothetical protein
MADKGTAQQYSYGRPEPAPRVQVAKDPSAIASVLSDPQRFKPMTRTVPGLHGDIPHLVMAEASDARLSPMAAAFSEAVASEASSYLETRTVRRAPRGATEPPSLTLSPGEPDRHRPPHSVRPQRVAAGRARRHRSGADLRRRRAVRRPVSLLDPHS